MTVTSLYHRLDCLFDEGYFLDENIRREERLQPQLCIPVPLAGGKTYIAFITLNTQQAIDLTLVITLQA